MKNCIILIISSLLALMPAAAQNLVRNAGFEETGSNFMPAGWTTFSPREEIAPRFGIDNTTAHSGKNSALIQSVGRAGTYGWWTVKTGGLKGSKKNVTKLNTLPDTSFLDNTTYIVSCYFKTSGPDQEKHVRIKLTWFSQSGEELFTEFVSARRREGDWIHVAEIKKAPLNASYATLNLILQWTSSGTVWWDDISFEPVPAPSNRSITIASAAGWPKSRSTTEKNMEYYSDMIVRAGKAGADIICLGEGITVVGTGKTYVGVSEPVPGPTTKALGEAARKAGLYVVAGIYEREGGLVYNTAVLIDRQGNVAGKYRKTHLPQAEVEGGLMPGSEYPVFKTDFGNIGIEICYDNFFPEVVRSLVKNGAEIIFCPIWGDIRGFGHEWDIVARARAIDNAVHFVASMYEKDGSIIIDPDGRILSRADGNNDIIISRINPDRRTFERWLSMKSYGEWKNLFPNEMRTETY